MTLPAALALVSLLLSLFTLVAVGGVYARLRMLEQSVLDPAGAQLADQSRKVPDELRPRGAATHALALLLDAGCGVCAGLWKEIAERPVPGTRVVGVFASQETAASFEGPMDKLAGPDLWTALYEGYAPCIYLITPAGEIADRRFVYGDTDIPALLKELLPALSESGSSHAS
ncbi:hypothetical protein ACIBO5_45415 [Nonomuraea angiospora]|uniref:hypothetical protein n=1 Tax=Nonomuraea angiospora TaxID=46172 RepID=UPI0029A9A037|nr:hypothetical protein [Nonomuraea angiospora]MDX3104763.1 hypothetical protein [Nonomuraea angiospora]